MIVLGIESTAHTLGIGVTKGKRILSNEMDIYRPVNEGIIPRKAADHHEQVFSLILKNALKKAEVSMEDVDLISFAQGPGIGAPLKMGVTGAKYLAMKYEKEIIGVNHPYAHIKISEMITGMENPLVLYVSGGNTQILWEKEPFEFQILGETLDIGVGNLFDSFSRKMGDEYAHGSVLEKTAEKGEYIQLPYSVKGMNLVFSGLLTSAVRKLKTEKKEDVAHSLMETAFAELCEAAERALFLTHKKSLIVCGGVAQNKKLKKMLGIMCREINVNFDAAPDEFNRDNGAMIAYAGYLCYKEFGGKKPEKWNADQDYRISRIKEHLR
ncbi:tRNA (adenosine(37)-N6)-threonylcarbamoyltransferase complex transferase subunit TsaD [Candidatus Micrarchaeota archaeon]|nr:tRNA (adenosine(37)-N6)-threonylcarbamoyltransferase complex transferase subunit TsaD [Candidatus Micrarchaeota archaeon]